MSSLQALTNAVSAGNRTEAKRLTQELLDSGAEPQHIVEQGLVPGMALIGERFKCNEAFVPEMLVAARAMKEAMAMLEPMLVKAGVKPKYTAVIGTVEGDLHDIGKNLVGMMWKGANFGVVDLGTNVSSGRFIAAAREHQAQVIGLSALLTTTMPAMRDTVKAVKEASLTGVKVVVGGAPITREFSDEIGADGFAADAASAVDLVNRLMGAEAA
jgi:5-methyltetrahydrofolate--homocysteine methyltransferase